MMQAIRLDGGFRRSIARFVAGFALLAGLTAPIAPKAPAPAGPAAGSQTLALRGTDGAPLPLFQITTGDNSLIVDRGSLAQERNARIPMSGASLSAMRGFAAIGTASPQYGNALRCLTQAVYYEAANEPDAGQRAVAQVVLNRMRHPAYPSSVCGVVYQGWDRPVCQFSFVCDGALRRTPMRGLWNRAEKVARSALDGHVEKSVGSATHYHADYVVPRWAYTLGKIRQIGAHIFYRFPGSPGEARAFTRSWIGVERIPRVDFSRFEVAALDEEEGLVETDPLIEAVAALPPDPTDRRAENDIGGRLDTSKQWRLDIPDPTQASSAYRSTLQTHGDVTGAEPK